MIGSDAELVQAARQGARSAFAELVQRHRTLLVRLCRRALADGGLAEDAAQEAIVLALVELDHLRRPERFGAWLCGIGLHVCRAWLRQRSRDAWSLDALVGGRLLQEPVALEPSPHNRAEESELARVVRGAIESLPPGQRAAVALFYLDGLSYLEIAATLDIEIGAVKTRLNKARRALGARLLDTWKEYSVTTSTIDSGTAWVDVQLEDVRRFSIGDPPVERSVLLLKETAGERLIPIWVGAFEADAAALQLVGAEPLRPLTFSFTAKLLEAAGGRVQEVRISRLEDETFYAEVLLRSPGGTRSVDARPSDAVNLALTVGAPIRVERSVLEQAGRTAEQLAESRPEGTSRSAREAGDAIRTRIREHRTAAGQSSLF
jgi:RNA polymerase sigma factor (sigma-70 family)